MVDLYEDYAKNHLMRLSTDKTKSHKQQTFLENYKDALPSRKDARILEIGPGLGETADLLVRVLGYTQYSAVDISSDIVRLHALRPELNIQQVEDPAAHLDTSAGQYDLIIMLHVLEHVPRHLVVPLLRSAHLALRERGEILVEVPNVANMFIGTSYAFGDFTHETAFTSTSLREVLGSAGFTDLRTLPIRIPRVSMARWVQYYLQTTLNQIQTLLAKVYWPSGTPLFSHFITARGRK